MEKKTSPVAYLPTKRLNWVKAIPKCHTGTCGAWRRWCGRSATRDSSRSRTSGSPTFPSWPRWSGGSSRGSSPPRTCPPRSTRSRLILMDISVWYTYAIKMISASTWMAWLSVSDGTIYCISLECYLGITKYTACCIVSPHSTWQDLEMQKSNNLSITTFN